jgi:hypothetical protein
MNRNTDRDIDMDMASVDIDMAMNRFERKYFDITYRNHSNIGIRDF